MKSSFHINDVCLKNSHCVKNVRIWNYSGLYFSAFGLNTQSYGESLRIKAKYEKIRTSITPYTDTFHPVSVIAKKNLLKRNSKDVSL